MGQYKEDSKELLHLVGGKENLSIQPQYMPSFALSMLVAIVVPFVLTTIIGKKKGVGKAALATEEGIRTAWRASISAQAWQARRGKP